LGAANLCSHQHAPSSPAFEKSSKEHNYILQNTVITLTHVTRMVVVEVAVLIIPVDSLCPPNRYRIEPNTVPVNTSDEESTSHLDIMSIVDDLT